MSMAAIGARKPGAAATPSPLPKTLPAVLATPFRSTPKPLDLLALIVDGATSAVDPATDAPTAGS